MFDYGTKVANNGATDAGILTHAEDNVRFRELENAITTAGIGLDDIAVGSLNEKMLAEAMARYASGGVFAENTGSADNLTFNTVSDEFVLPKQLFDGLAIGFRPGDGLSNTGAVTINFNGIGSKDVTDQNGDALTGGEFFESHCFLIYHAGSAHFRLAPWANSKSYASGGGGGGSWPDNVVAVYSETRSAVSIEDWTDTGIEATITPTSDTAKILVNANIVAAIDDGWNGVSILHYNRGPLTRIVVDGSPDVAITKAFGGAVIAEEGERDAPSANISVLHTPGSTDPITYKIQVKPKTTLNTVYINQNYAGYGGVTEQGGYTHDPEDDRFCSSLVLMEI